MNIQPLASSSAANCTLVDDGSTQLLLDGGLRMKALRRGLGFNVGAVAAMLLSHSHSDHARGVSDLLRAGVDCYMLVATAEALGVTGHHRVHAIEPHVPFDVGSWTVKPFDLEHDVPNVGYVLVSAHGPRVLFLTDTAYCRYRFSGITHLLIETNFSEALVERNVESGALAPVVAHRVRRSHLGLERALDLIRANDWGDSLREVHLLHLSAGNSHATDFKRRVAEVVGVPVHVSAERTAA